MIVAASQPYFCPFPGYFYKACLSDILVVLDAVQFPQGTTWITRNRFKNDQGALWITVPVMKKGLGSQMISEIMICQDKRWKRKHMKTFRQAYAKGPYFKEHQGVIEEIFSRQIDRILDLDLEIITYVMKALRLETKIVLLSDLGVRAKGSQLLIEICKQLKATQFIVQKSAKKHLDEALFKRAGFQLRFFTPPIPVYPQLWGDFIPNLSVFDLLFNCGPKARDILVGENLLYNTRKDTP